MGKYQEKHVYKHLRGKLVSFSTAPPAPYLHRDRQNEVKKCFPAYLETAKSIGQTNAIDLLQHFEAESDVKALWNGPGVSFVGRGSHFYSQRLLLKEPGGLQANDANEYLLAE